MALTLDDIRMLYDRHGDIACGGELMTQREHTLQSVQLAEEAGAGDALIALSSRHGDYNEQRPHSALNYLTPVRVCGETSDIRGCSCRFLGVDLKKLC